MFRRNFLKFLSAAPLAGATMDSPKINSASWTFQGSIPLTELKMKTAAAMEKAETKQENLRRINRMWMKETTRFHTNTPIEIVRRGEIFTSLSHHSRFGSLRSVSFSARAVWAQAEAAKEKEVRDSVAARLLAFAETLGVQKRDLSYGITESLMDDEED